MEVRRWRALETLLDRPWFSRVWVLQEVGLGRRVVAFVGRTRIDLAAIIQICVLQGVRLDLYGIEVHPSVGRLVEAFLYFWPCLTTHRDSWLSERPILKHFLPYYQSTPSTFIDIMRMARGFKASDSRDYVYALLGD